MNFRILLAFIGVTAMAVLAASRSMENLANLRFGNEQQLLVERGFADFQGLDPESFFHTRGTALFFPGEFLEPGYRSPDEIQTLIAQKNPLVVDLKTRNFPFPIEQTDQTFGTFLIYFRNNEPGTLRFDPLRVYHPLAVFIASHEGTNTIVRLGRLDKNPMKVDDRRITADLSENFDVRGDFLLYGHVSSPLHKGRNTLNMSTFLLGPSEIVLDVHERLHFFLRSMTGCLFFMAVFYGFIFTFRRLDRSSLYLSAYAAALSVFGYLFTGLGYVKPTQASIMVSILNIIALGFLQLYALNKIQPYLSQLRLRSAYAVFLSIFVVGIAAQLLHNKALIGISFILNLVFSGLLLLSTLIMGIKNRIDGIGYFACGCLLNISFHVPVVMAVVDQHGKEYGYGILIAHFCMAISLALVNAKEFAVTHQRSIQQSKDLEEKNARITYLNQNLEKLVQQKTSQIRSLLDHIPQGVLSLEGQGLVSNEYSAHLVDIVETDQIAQSNFHELVLNHCDLSSDDRDQIWQALLASLGESMLSWEINSSKLPTEIAFRGKDQIKSLRVTWNVKSESDTVQNILVTLLDITNEKQLEKIAEGQKLELRLLTELIVVDGQKLDLFFRTAEPLIRESKAILSQSAGTLSDEDVRRIFMNVHTVKGAARTLNLKALAATIHSVEDRYSAIIKDKAPVEPGQLNSDFDRLISLFNLYTKINRTQAQKDRRIEKAGLSEETVERLYQFLVMILQQPDRRVQSLISTSQDLCRQLEPLVFEDLSSILKESVTQIHDIARELGKEEPSVVLDLDAIKLPRSLRTVLDHCMTHIIRNAMDHGIEQAQERSYLGKERKGTIHIKAEWDRPNHIAIRIKDDGRGLAIGKLRERGLKRGMISETAELHEIAELVFAPGVSTAEKVSDISGRGIGMDAVRSFLKRSQGDIQIVVGQPKDAFKKFYEVEFVIGLPLQAVPLSEAS